MRYQGPYTLDDLLDAWVTTYQPPRFYLEEYAVWDAELLACAARCFGVALDPQAYPEPQRAVAIALCDAVERIAKVPFPGATWNEASAFMSRYRPQFNTLKRTQSELLAVYRAMAHDLANTLWGELGERSLEEMQANGLDFTRAPAISTSDDW